MTPDANIGRWIMGQYRIERKLASGGMGTVYLARQVSMERFAAVKMLRSSGADEQKERLRFQREARAASRLAHPNIVTIYNFGELEDGSLFLAMEYVDGVCLDALVEGRGALPLPNLVEIAQQCTTALFHAHEKGVIHRDLKPSNVMVSNMMNADHVKVLDFGLARLGGEVSTLTRTGALMGTPRYMAPEQWEGKPVTARVDQYALGLVLWEMIVGRWAVDRETPLECLHAHLSGELPAPSSMRKGPQVALFDPIVARLCAKQPEERYGSMGDLSLELRRVARELDLPSASLVDDSVTGAGAESFHTERTVQSVPVGETVLEAREAPARVLLLGRSEAALRTEGRDAEVSEEGELQLLAFDLLLGPSCDDPQALTEVRDAAGQNLASPDLFVIDTTQDEWRQEWQRWSAAGVEAGRALVAVRSDDPIRAAELAECADACRCVSVRAGGDLDPLCVGLALSWVRSGQNGGMRALQRAIKRLSDGEDTSASQMLQLTSASQASAYAEELIADVRSQGVRKRPTLRALGQLAEEMAVGAFAGAKTPLRQSQPIHSLSDVTLGPGQQILLRWAVLDKTIALAVRDCFGTLNPRDVISSVYSEAEPVAGSIGLRIMFQQARHLCVCTVPGAWSEVLAIVDREPSSRHHDGGRSLCLVTLEVAGSGAITRRQIGDRLTMIESMRDGVAHVALEGDVNETSNFSTLFDRSGDLVLDLAGVRRMNSIGIRTWLNALGAHADRLSLVFERCSLAVVSQINIITNFASAARITSIMAPYYCDDCEHEQTELLQIDEIVDRQPPARHCSKCASLLSFDEIPAAYFSFLGAPYAP